MASDRRAAERALIACRHDHEDSTSGGLIERLVQRLFALRGWMRKREAQIDCSYASVEAVLNRRSKFLRRGARHGLASGSRFRKNGTHDEGAVGANGGGRGVPIGKENASDKGTVQTGGAPGLHAGPPVRSRNLTDMVTDQIRMVGQNRAIDEPDPHVRATPRALHQRWERDQLQRAHSAFSIGSRHEVIVEAW